MTSWCDVLVVEDDVVQCEELAAFLRRRGFKVQIAHDGKIAIQRTSACRPHVALVDFNLPDMTGVQVAERLRVAAPEAEIIIMSGRIESLSDQTLAQVGIHSLHEQAARLGAAALDHRRADQPEPVAGPGRSTGTCERNCRGPALKRGRYQ